MNANESTPTPADTYRGFDVRWSDVNSAFNARPTAETMAAHPYLVPIAARTWAALTPVIDFQYSEAARKATWWESGK